MIGKRSRQPGVQRNPGLFDHACRGYQVQESGYNLVWASAGLCSFLVKTAMQAKLVFRAFHQAQNIIQRNPVCALASLQDKFFGGQLIADSRADFAALELSSQDLYLMKVSQKRSPFPPHYTGW